MPLTKGEWKIGRSGNSVVAEPPLNCDCSQCQPSEYGRTVDHYGGHCICESAGDADAMLLAQAKRMYEAAKAMKVNENAMLRSDATAIEVDGFAEAWDKMQQAVADAEKPFEAMPEAPKPVRPAFTVK